LKTQVRAAEHYLHSYTSLQTFGDQWIAADLVLHGEPGTVLEIGVGQRVLSHYLGFLGVNVFTTDIDLALSPDIQADVRELPFQDGSFDVVCCFEVLEHIPYDDFLLAATRCFAKARKRFIFSVPDVKYVLAMHLRFEIGTRNVIDRPLQVVFPRLYKRKLGSHQEHYWEIGRAGYPLSRILRDLSNIPGVGRIEHHRSVSTNSIRFFVLTR
jgi:SAM-dependent methyltransferase